MNLLTTARERIEQARDALGIHAATLERYLTDVERLDATTIEQADRIRADERLALEAKRSDLQAVAATYRQAAEEVTTATKTTLADAERSLRAKLEVPAPEGPDAQGRLANARTDAMMILNSVSDNEIVDTLEVLARDPGDVSSLVLGDWTPKYLQARRHNPSAARWAEARDQLAAERLGPEAQAALERLKGLQPARPVPEILTHHAHQTAASVEGTG